MNLIDMTNKERYAMMRKRHTFLSETVKGYTSLEEYARDRDEWFAIRGINLELRGNCVSLCNYLLYNEYEEYFVVPTSDGHLAISHVIWWQNDVCANEIFNILEEEIANEDDILTSY